MTTLTENDLQVARDFERDFVYAYDIENHGMKEHWTIPINPTGTPVRDDCDGFATGLLYRLVGGDKDAFWEALQDGTAEIVKVWARYVEGGPTHGSHAVLKWKGHYICNIFPKFSPKLIHKLNRVYTPTDVRMKMVRSGTIAKALDSGKKRTLAVVGGVALLILLFMATAGRANPGDVETLDILEFRKGPVWHELYYANSGDQSSKSVENKVMTLDGLSIVVNIALGSKFIPGAERITVEAGDPNILFEIVGETPCPQRITPDAARLCVDGPYAVAHVKDGEYVVIQVKQPLFRCYRILAASSQAGSPTL